MNAGKHNWKSELVIMNEKGTSKLSIYGVSRK
jgi:hypothetical protein